MTIRRFGATPPWGRPHRPRPGAYAAIRLGGGVLLTATTEFQLPGGGIDPGEQPLAALHREVLEETGWRIAVLRRVGAFRAFQTVPPDAFVPPVGTQEIEAEKICVVYAARAVRRLGAATEPGHLAVHLAEADALEAVGHGGQRAMLARALALPAGGALSRGTR